ncbi:hypothetical protein GCM10023331_24760 [Algivirga pacifica]|uniref:FAS1 domain-containing protein n=2 Tax=Algivirga pacifica TaxID=1162670 RepID=A0ABP9DD23_9BACT
MAFTSCDEEEKDMMDEEMSQTIAEIVGSNADFSTLLTALQTADLASVFGSEESTFTVFAPDNAAFNALLSADNGISSLGDISAEDLDRILKYHVVPGAVASSALSDGQKVVTLSGDTLMVAVSGSSITVNGIPVKTADVEASNGVIHIIGGVLLPPAEEMPSNTIADVVSTSQDFTVLLAALQKAELAAVFADKEASFTVFAPNDAAFQKLLDADNGISSLDDLDKETLTTVLQYHVVEGDVMSTDLSDGMEVETLLGEKLMIKVMDGMVYVNGAMVTTADVTTDNGVIHVIDEVLMPTSLTTIADVVSADENFSTLLAALQKAELAGVFADKEASFTVFAPDNMAFQALLDADNGINSLDDLDMETLTKVLKFHVVEGMVKSMDLMDGDMIETLAGEKLMVKIMDGNVYINGAMVKMADVKTGNGVIHVIDEVLMPTSLKTIADVVSMDENFSTLLAALQKAELAGVFADAEASYTVFAPDNMAFQALLDADNGINSLDDLDMETLTKVLKFHVAEGNVMSMDLMDGDMIETLAGEKLMVKIMDGNVYINGAMVKMADVKTANGVIHVIDQVLLPPTPMNIAEIVSMNDDFSFLLAALQKAELVDTFTNDMAAYTVFAPNNAAFQALFDADNGISSLDDLTVETLTAVLTYHVAEGKVKSMDLMDQQMIPTLQGGELTVDLSSGVMINNANVVEADVMATNGIIHVIDSVLLP